MTTITKDLGIWMDHATACMTEYTLGSMTTTELKLTFTHEDKIASMAKSESLSHHKEQHEQAAYYKKIGETILNYDRVILFGPTDAKSELRNRLRLDRHFDKIDIEIQVADKMTEHEQQLFVRKYFTVK